MDTQLGQRAETRPRRSWAPTEFANADHTTTLIKTEKGRTILLEHNVYTPRPYSRMYQLTGTKGFANKYPDSGLCLRPRTAFGVGRARPREPERPPIRAQGGAGGADGSGTKTRSSIDIEAKAQRGRRSRRHGLHHGLPPGLLPATWPAARSGCLRCGRMVVHRRR